MIMIGGRAQSNDMTGDREEKCENSYFWVSSALGKSRETHLINSPSFQSRDITCYPVEALNFFLIFVEVINGTRDYVLLLNESRQLYMYAKM